MNIVFTGYMASGKSVVGKQLSADFDLPFYDTDSLIEKKCNTTISKIFEENGEEYFRKIETEVIREVSTLDGAIISTGGGAVLRMENIDALRKNGVIINLEPTEEVIKERLSGDDGTRPLVKGSSLDEIIERFNKRKPYYDSCDFKIKVTRNKQIGDVVEEISKILEENYEGEFWSSRK